MAPKADDNGLFARAPVPVAALDDAQRLACLRLIRSDNVGPITFRELINHFGGATNALAALPELARRAARGRTISICPADKAEAELEAARRHGARPLFTIEPGYPTPLAHLAVPPPLIYVKGRLDLLERDTVAFVGSRNASAAGVALTRQLASKVGEDGYVVVSGLARGIDSAAHEATLATGTIAVLAGGIDNVYPPENAGLQARIGEIGCLVTEQPPGYPARGRDFRQRNRIISGLSLGVVVIEAAQRSGSLITARAAAEQGREVMAVPGHPLDPRSEGPNALLKQPGVTMVTAAADILEVLAPMRSGRRDLPTLREADAGPHAPVPGMPLAPPSAAVGGPSTTTDDSSMPEDAADALLKVLGRAPATLDDAARAAGLSARVARIAALELAVSGNVELHGGQFISRKPR